MYWEEMLQESGARNDLGNNITEVERVTGTSRAYSIARVKKMVSKVTTNSRLAAKRLTHFRPMIRLTLDPALAAANIREKMGEEL